jgi:hypothetical protein
MIPKFPQCREELRRLPNLLTQLACPGSFGETRINKIQDFSVEYTVFTLFLSYYTKCIIFL